MCVSRDACFVLYLFQRPADIIADWFVDMPLEEGVEIAHRGEQFKDGLPEPLQEDAIIQQEGVVFLDVPEESVALPNIGQRVQPAGPPEREARDEKGEKKIKLIPGKKSGLKKESL